MRLQRYVFFSNHRKKVIHSTMNTTGNNRNQTFLIDVKTPVHGITKVLSSPTVVGVGKELVGIW